MQERAQAIREVQRYLGRIALADDRIPFVAQDGIFGVQTRAAVQAFQQAYGLPVTGQVDAVTFAALAEVDRAVREYADRGEGITVLQNGQQQLGPQSDAEDIYVLQAILGRLHQNGYLPDAVPIDGIYGPETKRAVRYLRRIGNLPEGETVDRAAWNVISALYNSVKEEKR